MADWNAIKAAVATKSKVTGVNQSTSTALEGAPDTPAVFISHFSDFTVTTRGIGWELVDVSITGYLVLSRAPGLGVAMDEANDILERIRVAMRTGTYLGMEGTVQDSSLASAQESSDIDIAGIQYVGFTLAYLVRVRENVTRSGS